MERGEGAGDWDIKYYIDTLAFRVSMVCFSDPLKGTESWAGSCGQEVHLGAISTWQLQKLSELNDPATTVPRITAHVPQDPHPSPTHVPYTSI